MTGEAPYAATGYATDQAAGRTIYPLASRVWVWVVVCLVYVLSIIGPIVPLTDALAAHQVGAHPGSVAAISADHPCGRCAPTVTYQVGQTTYRETLKGSADATAGTRLVYKAGNPTEVMTDSTWRGGRSARWLYALLWAVGVDILLSLTIVVLGRRRLDRFGLLRPDQLISRVTYLHDRRGSTWRVRFGDGRRARYRDSGALRSALAARRFDNPAMVLDGRNCPPLGGVAPAQLGHLAHPAWPAGQPGRSAGQRQKILVRATVAGLLTGVVVVAGVFLLVRAARHTSNSSVSTQAGAPADTNASTQPDGAGCQPGDAPTAGPTPAATQYLAALATTMPSWLRVDSSLDAHPGEISNAELGGETSADESYLQAVAAIKFPASSAATVAQLTQAVQDYDAILTAALGRVGYLNEHREQETQALDRRSAASASLRDQLGLPPSQCSLLRP